MKNKSKSIYEGKKSPQSTLLGEGGGGVDWKICGYSLLIFSFFAP